MKIKQTQIFNCKKNIFYNFDIALMEPHRQIKLPSEEKRLMINYNNELIYFFNYID